MRHITPVLLSGGIGSRLWPVSRKALPKQFARLIGEESLFTSAALRFAALGLSAPVVVTGESYRFLVRDQLSEAEVDASHILIEPDGRNTAPAILTAALVAAETDPQGLILAAPCDHLITDTEGFGIAIAKAEGSAKDGAIVTFGISPTRPETGYGYLELEQMPGAIEAVKLSSFVEKPDGKRAAEMLASGRYLWNAGMFLARCDTLINAFAKQQPKMLEAVGEAVRSRKEDLGFERLGFEAWQKVKGDSIDYAIMEGFNNTMVVPYRGGWSDLGDWDAMWRESEPDDEGVVTIGDSIALDCRSSYLRSDSDDLTVVGLGLEDLLVVATSDAVLVADKSRTQQVKSVVEKLQTVKSKQADTFPRDHRPWGWYDVLAFSDRFQVKRIVVNPGASLSLQSHMHRAEHWIVVSGSARVTIDDSIRLLSENQSIYVPLGAKHRLENPGKVPMILIEVQSGSYLGEDDIIRYDDPYKR